MKIIALVIALVAAVSADPCAPVECKKGDKSMCVIPNGSKCYSATECYIPGPYKEEVKMHECAKPNPVKKPNAKMPKVST